MQQDLLGTASVATAGDSVRGREVTPDEGGPAALRAGGADPSFIGACPDCGSQLAFSEGCAKCHVCGFSECG